MLELTNPVLLFNKQKLVNLKSPVGNSLIAGIEANKGKEIVILYRYEGSEFLTADDKNQLLKILSACKLKEEDVVLINTAVEKNSSLRWLRKNFRLRTLIVFGDIEISPNLTLKKYFTYRIDGLQIIKSEPIAKLIKSAPDKKALWEELKGLFKID